MSRLLLINRSATFDRVCPDICRISNIFKLSNYQIKVSAIVLQQTMGKVLNWLTRQLCCVVVLCIATITTGRTNVINIFLTAGVILTCLKLPYTYNTFYTTYRELF